MPKVVYVLVRTIPAMNVRRATALMYEAHSKGQATVKRCHRELAEMYAEKLQQRGLTSAAELGAGKASLRKRLPGSSWTRRKQVLD